MSSTVVPAPPEQPGSEAAVGEAPHHKGRIGLIVAGSIATGAVGALVLDVVVFAGAKEDVITGATFLAFAAGWAMLALLSTRRTDQPQAWAWVPAGVMATLGLGHLVLQPGNAALEGFGWVWPIPLLGLVVWMTRQSR